ncbi:carbonic anhydrase [Tuber borchii]|uniref:Carbonic anhydrase n=1 Tax=Tuber borchii TaxID=42251 RepID=A0A2T6ZSE9_TUBBO|nr:carbonic anhydrase [Tuber borchii]
MTDSQNIKDLVRANEEYVKNFPKESSGLDPRPSRKLLIVTCMDARFHPSSAFALALGSTHIVRNAGGTAEEALPSIRVSQHKLGTEELLLIKHTKCGMYPDEGPDEIRERVIGDVNLLRNHGEVKGSISGWLYDVDTGEASRVV